MATRKKVEYLEKCGSRGHDDLVDLYLFLLTNYVEVNETAGSLEIPEIVQLFNKGLPMLTATKQTRTLFLSL